MDEKISLAISNAIKEEEESYKMYMHWKDVTDFESSKRMCERLANEELGHKALLEGIDKGDLDRDFIASPNDIGLADELVMTPLAEYPVINELFTLAIKKEGQAQQKYSKIAKGLKPGELQDLFKGLAASEANHKKSIQDEQKKVGL